MTTADGRETIVAGLTIGRIGTTHSQPCTVTRQPTTCSCLSLSKQMRHCIICPVSILTLVKCYCRLLAVDDWFTPCRNAAVRNQAHLHSVTRKLLYGKWCRSCIPRSTSFLRHQKVTASTLLFHSCYFYWIGHLYNNLTCGLRLKING
jgi:hypothetical protein